jgi:5-methylcytosine-specific restriction enzyme subunit McrC
MTIIDVFEYGRLNIDEKLFKREHWNAFVKLNDAHEGKYFEVLHNGLRFKQFVGVIQVDGLLVQIHPKADKDDTDAKWRDVLLPMLKACGRIKAQTAGDANLNKQHLNLLEVYFAYFMREVEQLLHQGLVKKYRKETGNVKALKGKLDFSGNIRQNLVHKERFYTTHQVYDTNHRLHQVLALALEIIDVFTRGTRLNDQCKRIKLAFPEVDTIRVNTSLLESIKLDRKTAPYERAFDFAKLIILNYSPDINQGKNKMISLLFDMNELWEEYVLVMLKKSINNVDSIYYNKFSISGQKRKRFWGSNYLIPDIELINKKDDTTIIIDTKWKRPGNSASVEDLRQMYTYARFWDAEKVMLLYPGKESSNRIENYLTDDYQSNHPNNETGISINHTAQMCFVQVIKDNKVQNSENNFLLNDELGEKILNLIKQ